MTAGRSNAARGMLAVVGVLVFAILCALGTWQVKRLYWKRDLIERVDRRVHADPVAAPGPDRWADVTAQSDEYRHVRVTGTYLPGRSTLVQAVTDLGSGFWLLTPLRTDQGSIVLINRGYVPSAADAAAFMGQGTAGAGGSANNNVSVTGLLRMTEPGGGFLRKNDPAANRWYSRDVQAIAASRGLSPVAPFFIDADATANASGRYPVGGLTVVAFSDNHLVYALTWYALALMVAGGGVFAMRQDRRLPNRNPDGGIDDVSAANRHDQDNQDGS